MSKKVLVVLLLASMLALPAFGQTFGQISGVVYDTSGAVMGGVMVIVTNPQTSFTRTTTTNDTGNYSFPALQPGLYNVRAEIAGFQAEVRNSVELQVQQAARIDFRMQVGALSETVEVAAGAPLLNTENATVGTVIENKRILDLPLNGRSFMSLIALSPNVTAGQNTTGGFAQVRGGTDRGLASVSVAGLRREFNFYSLDGVSNTDVDFNTYILLPSIDALQEFKVQSGVYSAEFGRAAAHINVSTKNGTNEYHGSVFEFIRNNRLDARPYAFTSRVPDSAPFKWNQYGFTVGGPVQIPKLFNGKDRLFFLSNFEGFKLRQQSQITVSVPSAAMREGNFSEILPGTIIRDPQNRDIQGVKQPFPGNIIPKARLNPVSVQLLEFLPLPNIPGAGLVNNHLALQNNTSDKNQFTQRIDFVENSKSNWFGRYSWQDESRVSPVLYKNGTVADTNIHQVMISNTRVFSPSLVNEFRTGYVGYHNSLSTELAFKRNVIQELGIPMLSPPAAGWGTPQVPILGFSTSALGYIGDGLQGPFVANNHTFQWIDNVSWVSGAHTVKFGGEIRRDRYNVFGNQTTRGQFVFQNQATGYGMGDYMLGYIQRSSITGILANSQLRATSHAYYINDNWKISPSLSIEAGLRYEYTPPWNSKSDSMSNIVFPDLAWDQPNAPLDKHPYFARDCAAYGQNEFYFPGSIVRFNPAIQTRCVTGFGSTTLVNKDFSNWAPRLGLAWSPSTNWTVRGGFGMFYVQDQSNNYFDTSRNIGAPQTSVLANTEINDLTWQKPFPTSDTCGVPSPPFICISSPVSFHNDIDKRNAYVVQYMANIQRQLTGSMVLEVGYLGSQAHRLLTKTNQNVAVPGAGSTLPRTPFPEFANINAILGVSRSNYNSGTIKLTRRLSHGVSALAGYTFSKSMDDSPGVNPQNGIILRTPQNGTCVKCEYGLSDFDTRHRFVTSVMYELPVGKGKRFLNQGIASSILGGWQLNSIVTLSTGFPSTIQAGVNRSNSNVASDRPNATAGEKIELDDPTANQWFNIRAFQLQPLFTFGNAGRNTIIGPGIVAWDFSTLKNFNINESSYVQFRFECFNCANHPVLGDPAINMSLNQLDANGIPIAGTGSFGRITSTRFDMRQLQFGLKIVF